MSCGEKHPENHAAEHVSGRAGDRVLAQGKVKTARKLRTAERVVEAKKSRAHYGIVVAAKAVVAAWPTNRLAEAVRDLDAALKSYDEVIK